MGLEDVHAGDSTSIPGRWTLELERAILSVVPLRCSMRSLVDRADEDQISRNLAVIAQDGGVAILDVQQCHWEEYSFIAFEIAAISRM
jgi:hypothetical protein